MIFDSHAHYDSDRFDSDRDTLLPELRRAGICGIINCADSVESARKCLSLADRYDFCFAAAGIHPHEAAGELQLGSLSERLALIEALLDRPKAVAVGEIGLDYHYDFTPRSVQKEWFSAQLELAVSRGTPVIVHDREAHADTLQLLQKYRPQGVVHCFSGSVETARELLSLGMYLGFGGSVTFANARHPAEAAAAVPLDRLLLETDAPYMAPVPFRGRRCDSRMIAATAEKIALLRGIPVESLLKAAAENARRLFSLPDLPESV